ncbi:MAG: FkbM family methyltransferase [Pseudomonadota bacterium]
MKAQLFADWPQSRLGQIYAHPEERLALDVGGRHAAVADRGVDLVLERLFAFQPEVVLYRVVGDSEAFDQKATRIIDALGCNLVTWIMDDWPLRMAHENPARFILSDRRLQSLLTRSVDRFSISDAMSEAFEERYGTSFTAFANGVDPADWAPPSARTPSPFRVRYAGAMAKDMTLHSVIRVAEAVESLAQGGADIVFEIRTRPIWKERSKGAFDRLRATSFFTTDLSPEDYRAWLSAADVVLVAYNFDAPSLRYIQHSMANKLPECLASGAALIAHGPPQAATIRRVLKDDVALVVTESSEPAVAQAISRLKDAPMERLGYAERAQAYAFASFDVLDTRIRLARALTEAKRAKATVDQETLAITEFPRSAEISVDETNVVAKLSAHKTGPAYVMLDIGAHVGSSAAYFDALHWKILCFEPDEANRTSLIERFSDHDNVFIDPRAVGEEPSLQAPFFKSEQSTGVSGLHGFLESHQQDGTVDVTTVERIAAEHHIEHVEFLKIDVEGFDLPVLRGLNWNSLTPKIVEVEFDDDKTKKLGYTALDICQYLAERGYTLYISEWHPIIQYGTAHDWRRVYPYLGEETQISGWGNILAFQEDPGYETILEAFSQCLKSRGAAGANKQSKSRSKISRLVQSGLNAPKRLARSARKRVRALLHRRSG